MGAIMTPTTFTQLAKELKVKPDSIRTKLARTSTGIEWGINRELTDSEADAIRTLYKVDKKKKRTRTVKEDIVSPVQDSIVEQDNAPDNPMETEQDKVAEARQGGIGLREVFFLALMAAPAVASLQNMQSVTHDITHDLLVSNLFTFAFTAAPFLFVIFNARGRAVGALTILLIAVEVFCNSVRIYGGLTGFGGSGNPTRFLGIVTEMLNTGTYQTAIFIAVILSLLAACVLYAAYYQVRK